MSRDVEWMVECSIGALSRIDSLSIGEVAGQLLHVLYADVSLYLTPVLYGSDGCQVCCPTTCPRACLATGCCISPRGRKG